MRVFSSAVDRLSTLELVTVTGSVRTLKGLTVLVDDLPASVGTLVRIETGQEDVLAEVVGFDRSSAIVMPLGTPAGLKPGQPVTAVASVPTIACGAGMLGRVINGLGEPIDGLGPMRELRPQPLHPPPMSAMNRVPIAEPLMTGVRAIDAFTTVGRGQRIGLFAGPGVGKTTLLSSIARHAQSSVNVIAMIGERGREVREFIEHTLGPEGLARSVVVVATSDESPLMRIRAAYAACAVAEHFRDHGQDVTLMIDSVTRFAHAQRQVGLSVGEPPATKGYTPSVFAQLPLLLERAGRDEGGGSITAFYTVLVEGDDMTEPIADAVRGILDGHIMLSRKLAQQGHFPAIDILDSISRIADNICAADHKQARREVVSLLAAYREVEELVQIGAYAQGSNPKTDCAIELKPEIDNLLRQSMEDAGTMEHAVEYLLAIANYAQQKVAATQAGAQAGGQAGVQAGAQGQQQQAGA